MSYLWLQKKTIYILNPALFYETLYVLILFRAFFFPSARPFVKWKEKIHCGIKTKTDVS
jgi:hypothetical protein